MGQLAVNGGGKTRAKSFPAWPVWNDAERQNLLAALESGRWGSLNGHFVQEFANAYAAAHDAKFGVCVPNGTVALQVAVEAAGVGIGDEVIVPPYTFVATASAVVALGGIPIFADIDPGTFCLDPAVVEAAITPRTKAVIPVHLGGCPADMDRFGEIARKYGVKIIEDAAHAHGGEWRGKKIGALGDMGCFSFQWSKNMTGGEGGIILTNHDDLYAQAWSISNVGRRPQGAWYEHFVLGGNYRMTEWQAAVLLAQLARLPEQTAHRARMAAYLDKLLIEVGGIVPQARDPRVTLQAFHLYVFRFLSAEFNGISRGQFVKALNAEGIPVTAGYSLLNRQPVFAEVQRDRAFGFAVYPETIDYPNIKLPVAEKLADSEGCWLTQNMLLGDERDMEDIAGAIEKIKKHSAELAV